MSSADYLARRGLAEVGRRYGARVEKIGPRARKYGLHDPAAQDAYGLFIKYQGGDDRLRLIDGADQLFPGGKYRGVAGSKLTVYDPRAELVGQTPEKVLAIEGELNCLSILAVSPNAPVVGLPGKRSMKPDLAARFAGVERVLLWVDRDADFEETVTAIARGLLKAGVGAVYVVPDTGGDDANDILVKLTPHAARQRFRELLDAAREAGPFVPPLEKVEPLRPPRPVVMQSDGLRDQVAAIPADEWLSRLLGIDTTVGRKIKCPVHDERTPSCHVYADHVYCHGCGQSLDAFSMAGRLWDLDPANSEHFKELLGRLSALFGLAVSQVAA